MTSLLPIVRGVRGAEQIRSALGVADPRDAAGLISACRDLGRAALGLAPVRICVADRASRVRPEARGQYCVGVITLYPRAFADPLALAYTLLHEMGHGAGLDEAGAHAFASERLLHNAVE